MNFCKPRFLARLNITTVKRSAGHAQWHFAWARIIRAILLLISGFSSCILSSVDSEHYQMDPGVEDLDYLTRNLGTARPRGTVRDFSTKTRKKKRFFKLKKCFGSCFSCLGNKCEKNETYFCPAQNEQHLQGNLRTICLPFAGPSFEKNVMKIYKESSSRTQALEEPPVGKWFLHKKLKNRNVLSFVDPQHNVDRISQKVLQEPAEETFRKLQITDCQEVEDGDSEDATQFPAVDKLERHKSTSSLIKSSRPRRDRTAGVSHFVSEEVQPIFDQVGKLTEFIDYPSVPRMLSEHKSCESNKGKLNSYSDDALYRKLNRNYMLRQIECVLMMQSEEWFAPRFAAEAVRVETLNHCSSQQLRGFQVCELARVGWYFNSRTLVTFCCGMEMPQQPRGQPIDVHRGLSPQCTFARSVQSPADIEQEQTKERQERLQTCGSQAEVGYGYQPVDDPYGIYGQAVDAVLFDSAFTIQDGYVQQETSDDQHWRTDGDVPSYSSPFPLSEGGRVYLESVVTSRTPADADRLPVDGIMRGSEAAARPAEQTRNGVAGRTSPHHMHTMLAGNPQNMLYSLMREPMPNPNFVNPGIFPEIHQGHDGNLVRPRHPHYAIPSMRLLTFEGWPATHQQKPHDLAEAGLFYAGYGDCCLCYFCGIGLRHWEPMDNPWIEHARWKPTCEFVVVNRGHSFAQAARALTNNNRHPTLEEVTQAAQQTEREREEAAHGPVSATEDAENVDSEEELEQHLCKACCTREMDTVLMPCRHRCVCHQCSQNLTTCPICRAAVDSVLRINQD